MFDFRRLQTDLIALSLLAATVFVGLSLISYDPADPPAQNVFPGRPVAMNLCGIAGAELAHALKTSVGISAYLLVFSMALFDLRLFSRQPRLEPGIHIIGSALLVASLSIAFQTFQPGIGTGPVVGSGGYVGAWGVALLEETFSTGGTLILITSFALAGLLLTTDFFFFQLAYGCAVAPLRIFNRIGLGQRTDLPAAGPEKIINAAAKLVTAAPKVVPPAPVAAPAAPAEESIDDIDDELDARITLDETDDDVDMQLSGSDLADDETAATSSTPPTPATPPAKRRKQLKVNPPGTGKSDHGKIAARLEANSQPISADDYELPELSLLEDAEEFPYELLAKKARVAAETLERTFQEFGLNVRVVEVDTGPVITQFELELEAGLRLSKVTSLADDLAVALRVPSVRVVSPIPGKNTVGVEVPNDKQVMVRLRELIESSSRDIEKMRMPIFLGKDVSGRPMVVDMTKMPHLLIAGRTGTGKSVCLNTLILSILMTRSPDQVKMLMIDPKMVELSPYKRIPHLMHPVITDMKKAEAVLAWAVDKMEERYDMLARCGVRHLDGYNKLGKAGVLRKLGIDPESEEAEQIPEQMPYIVIIADEMADMIMTSGKDVEGHIIRLAQKSRAVGIHLVLATQKPTVDVITGLIKSNLPARISFQVASRTDSRVVLDEMGAERLLGNGDMLYLAPGTSNLHRAQGTFVSDDEVNSIIDFFSDQEPQYSEELAQISAAGSSGSADASSPRMQDDLYEQAIEVVIREGRGSVSLLQRCLGIGYGRAARLVDYMAEDGIVGDYNGSQAREVLYTMEQWENLQADRELEESYA